MVFCLRIFRIVRRYIIFKKQYVELSKFITTILFISWELNAQVTLPTFQGVQFASFGLYSFSSHTFTNCVSTGYTGPTLANCKSSYDTSWEDDTDLFNVETQGIQLWTVPADGTYRIVAKGAAGGTNGFGRGGYGASLTVDVSLTKGLVLAIVVGQKGTGNSSSSNYSSGTGGGGGYSGGGGSCGSSNWGSGGGGGSYSSSSTNTSNSSGEREGHGQVIITRS